jgi:methyl-accepting chemotaxis protein
MRPFLALRRIFAHSFDALAFDALGPLSGVDVMFSFYRPHFGADQTKMAALDRSFALIEFTRDGNILSANENFCRTLGYAQAEIVGRHHSLFVPPEERESPQYQAFWRKLASGAHDAGAYARLRKDGALVYIQAAYCPLLDASGKAVGVLKVASDITQARLKALEWEAKIAALSRVQAIVEFTNSGEIIDANDNFFAAMGYRREEILGRRHRMFVEPAYADSPEYEAFWRRLNEGQAIVDSFRRIGKGGRVVWLQASYCPVADLSGKICKVVKFATDITDLMRLGDALARLARGDIERRIDAPFSPTFDKLRSDFNFAADNLNVQLDAIRAAMDTAGASAEQIAVASQDLSRRTESQAARLEETAAALEQATATVNKTAENARLADQAVGAARSDAEKSGEIVARAVEAMGRIEHSSRQIGAITGVIDEIAFQTNLLALNAGVEAARAGEAGRGFAVVASEVRALAQRSAEAAKQIKSLISTSSADVEAGVRLVRGTGESLGQIVGKVVEISALARDIAADAREQNAALREVNAAVSQMDQSTQQNAAMAEQANAAVESMKLQVHRLAEAVGEFKLSAATPRAETSTGLQRRIA